VLLCVNCWQTHNYCIEAVVLRGSWPLSQSQWTFVQALKQTEQADLSSEQNEVKGILLFMSQLFISFLYYGHWYLAALCCLYVRCFNLCAHF